MDVNYKNYRNKLGDEIMRKRKEKGLSREAVAAKIEGVSTKTIENIEKGNYNRDFGLHTIQHVCRELGISVKLTLGAVK